MIDYIKHRQRLMEEEWKAEEEAELDAEEDRIAEIRAEASRKQALIDQQEDERLQMEHVQRKQQLTEQKLNKQFDTLLSQVMKNSKSKRILHKKRYIIKNQPPPPPRA